MESKKYDSIQEMGIYIDKIYLWFFGDIENKPNHENTISVIKYIFESKDELLFFKLFQSTAYLQFNVKKQMILIITKVIKYFDRNQCHEYIINHTNENGENELIQHIFDNYDINFNLMLMEMVKLCELINYLLNKIKIQSKNRKYNDNFVDILLKLISSKNLMILTSSYQTFECLLTYHAINNNNNAYKIILKYFNHKEIAQNIFSKLNKLIFFNENCLIQRNGLKILHLILTLSGNDKMMRWYIDNVDNFINFIDLIKRNVNNDSISFQIFNIFKYFIKNKFKTKEIENIIFENKSILIDLLLKLDPNKACYDNFITERDDIVQIINS